MVTVRTISVGSNPKGRDFGILPDSRGVRLSSEASALLADFALALLAWGQASGGGRFDAFFPLHRDGTRFCLVRVAHRGVGDLGPLVVANALLLSAIDCAAFANRPHRVLGAISPPDDGPWQQELIELAPASFPPNSWLGPTIEALGARLHLYERPIVVSAADPLGVLGALLESAPRLPGWLPAWSTTSAIGRNGRFDPGTFALQTSDREDASSADFRWSGTRLEGPPLPESAAWRIWQALFGAGFAEAGRDRPAWENAESLLAWSRELNDAEPLKEARAAISRFLAAPDIGSDDLWSAMDYWTDTTATLEGLDRVSAQRAIALAYGDLLERQSHADAKVALAEAFLEKYAGRLPEAPQANIARLAVEQRFLGGLSDGTLLGMVDTAFVPTLTLPFVQAIVRQDLRSAQLDALAVHLWPQLEEAKNDSAVRAVAHAVACEGLVQGVGDPVGELGRDLLCTEKSPSEARELAARLFDYWPGRRNSAATGIRSDVGKSLREIFTTSGPSLPAREFARVSAQRLRRLP